MSGARRWTGGERRQVKTAILKEGATAREAGEEVGRTERAVNGYCRRCGVRAPLGSPTDLDKRADLLDFLGRGLSIREIARLRDVAYTTVWRMVKRLERMGLVTLDKVACCYVPVNL